MNPAWAWALIAGMWVALGLLFIVAWRRDTRYRRVR